jgi:hypothetical protein
MIPCFSAPVPKRGELTPEGGRAVVAAVSAADFFGRGVEAGDRDLQRRARLREARPMGLTRMKC